jgi:putative salt-induced outer membrane protein YdiY
VENNNSYKGTAQYNRLDTGRFFIYGRAVGSHDGIAGLVYRISLGPGVGYYFVKTNGTTLSSEIGPGYVFEDKEGQSTSYMSLRVAENFEHKFNDHFRIWEYAVFLPKAEDFNNYVANVEVGVESALTKKLSLRVCLDDTYDSEPAAGHVPNDMKLVSALAYKF